MKENQEVVHLYQKRRKFLQLKSETGVVLITTGESSWDSNLFDKNLEYLVGKVPPNSILLWIPQGINIDQRKTISGPEVGRGYIVKEILFITKPSRSPIGSTKNDGILTQYQKQSGVEIVKWKNEFNGALSRALLRESLLWINIPYIPYINTPVSPHLKLLNDIRNRFLWVQIKNIAPLIHEMRWVKDAYEIECLRTAFQIHTEIFLEIMKKLKSGVNESVGKAIFDYEIGIRDPLKVSGSWNDNYQANIIVASGKNALGFHYMDNNRVIQDSELVLIDAGVEYCGYCSDITRTFPANGKFTPRQKELYAIVLEAEKAAISILKPGVTQREAHYASYEVFKKYNLEKYSYGNAGHAVGLNIHDANDWGVCDQPLKVGCVIVLEPQIKIPEENVGIRIEDGIIIRENGIELLSGPPKEIEEIERLYLAAKE
jgi:Xaa-Pro aminopeptidase